MLKYTFHPVDLIIIALIIFLFVAFALPSNKYFYNKHREAEVKARTHRIQIALERYYVDNGEYPPYLLGGDIDGWEIWHERWDGVNDVQDGEGTIASNEIIVDPLIEGNYFTSYDSNIFTSDGRQTIRATTLNGSRIYGEGDPRFGFKGWTMGNCLDDPNYFGGTLQLNPEIWSEIETRRTLDHGDYMNVPDIFKNSGSGMYYAFGGCRNTSGEGEEDTLTHWPGNFFYRSIPGDMSAANFLTPYYESPQHYILGGFGKSDNPGLDVIRLETTDPDGNRIKWSFQEPTSDDPYYFGSAFSDDESISGYGYPAVFGGGDEWTGPVWPFIDKDTGEVLYGAPDGVPDGVIIVLVDGSEVERREFIAE